MMNATGGYSYLYAIVSYPDRLVTMTKHFNKKRLYVKHLMNTKKFYV